VNWFEDDSGQWWNLDLVKAIYSPDPDKAVMEFADDDVRRFSIEEWVRLKAQLINSQRSAANRQEAKGPEWGEPA
jgi:hypothetical protein